MIISIIVCDLRNSISYLFKVLRALSLDVVLGAISFSMFIASAIQVNVPPVIYMELTLAVWSIYTWDHLKDARSTDSPSAFRHQFHKTHQRKIFLGLLLALVLGAFLAYFLPLKTLYMGIMLCIFVLVYFIVIHFYSKFYHKEAFISILYALGIFLGPYSVVNAIFSVSQLFFSLIITSLIAFINLIIFSDFERKIDLQSGYPSLALAIGIKVKRLVYLLSGLSILLTAFAYCLQFISVKTFYCFLIMLAILGCTYLGRKYTFRNEYYRIFGDGVFFVPLLFL